MQNKEEHCVYWADTLKLCAKGSRYHGFMYRNCAATCTDRAKKQAGLADEEP